MMYGVVLRRWFCDLCLRRFATTLARGECKARTSEQARGDTTLERMRLEYADETTNDWGAASARDVLPGENLALGSHSALGVLGSPILEMDANGGRTSGDGNLMSDIMNAPRFRTFTVSCAHTAVTAEGAKAAEAIAPGLLVVLDEKPLSRYGRNRGAELG